MSTATTRTQIWTITLQDTTVLRYTRHDTPIVSGGHTFKPVVGVTPSQIDRDVDLKSANMQVDMLIDDSEITREDLRSGRFNGSRIELASVDWTDPDGQPQIVLLIGLFGTLQLAGKTGLLSLVSIEYLLSQRMGRTITLPCDASLGDSRCKYTLTADSCTVTAATSRLAFTDLSRTEADGHYNGGKLVWLTGANAGGTFDIKRYVAASDTIELYEPVQFDIQTGDTADLYRGCDKTIDTCVDVFSNGTNHQGNPYVPSEKDLISGNVA